MAQAGTVLAQSGGGSRGFPLAGAACAAVGVWLGALAGPVQASPLSLAALWAREAAGSFAGAQAAAAVAAAANLDSAVASSPGASGAPGPRFTINRFEVAGMRLVEPARLQAVLAPFTGPGRGFPDIEAAIEAVRAAYERAGITAVQVNLPEQPLQGGVVRLQVVEVQLAAVELVGAKFRSPENLRRAVPGLAEGVTPSDELLSAQLRLANENPGRQMQLTMRTDDKGRLVGVLRVADRPPVVGQLSLDNSGNASTGRLRVGLLGQHLNLLDRDIVGTVQLQTSPGYEDEVRIASVSLRLPDYIYGLMIDLSALSSSVDSGNVKTAAGDYYLSSSGETYLLRLTKLLPRLAQIEPRAFLAVESRRVSSQVSTAAGGGSLVPSVELRPLQLGVALNWRSDEASLNVQSSFSRNLPGGGRSAAAVFAEPGLRAGARPGYEIVRASIGAGFAGAAGSVSLAWNGQWTRDALVSAEQFGIGGEGSVRGFAGRLVSADSGQRLGLEWLSPGRPALEDSALEIAWVGFVDLGQVVRNLPQPSERVRTTLSGAGFGVRLGHRQKWSLRMDVGVVLRGEGVAPAGSSFVHAALDHSL